MTFAEMLVSRSLRRAGPALVMAASVLFSAPARAYDDKPAWTSVMELVGVGTSERIAAIDYRERSKLVVPPSRAALPEPRETHDFSLKRTGPLETALADDSKEKECGSKERSCWYPLPGMRFIGPKKEEAAKNSPRAYLVQPPVAFTGSSKPVVADADAGDHWYNPISSVGKSFGKLFGGASSD